jgi:hypothetical protein
VMPNNESGFFADHLRTRHAGITIRIGEVNVPSQKNVLIIRAACRKDYRAEERDLENGQREVSGALHSTDNCKLTIENRKLNGPARIRTWDQGIMSPLL